MFFRHVATNSTCRSTTMTAFIKNNYMTEMSLEIMFELPYKVFFKICMF